MKGFCCCSLAGTDACEVCANNDSKRNFYTPSQTWVQGETIVVELLKKVKRVTEKFDKEGNLVERIIEENN